MTTIFTAVAALAVGLSGGLGAVFASSAIIKSAAVDVGLKASGAALDKA